nr:ribonuclease H-like domain-containing protein [Tanacetum cinerariifolium]
MPKNLALIAKYFKKIYKPTNNNHITSSNSRNKNVDTTPRYKNDNQSRQFGKQRTVNTAGARENVGSPVVQQSGIQGFNCKEFGHFATECRKPKRVKDSAYHKEKMNWKHITATWQRFKRFLKLIQAPILNHWNRIRRRRYNLILADSKFKNLMLDHQDKYMMKAQVHVLKSFTISDIQALPRRKHYCQIYQVTPVDIESKLDTEGDPISDPSLYRSLAVDLQYLTFTRPDISYTVQQVCLNMHDPREPYSSALKRVLCYIRSTLDFGLQLYTSSTSSLVTYSDADWAAALLLVAETAWLHELHTPLLFVTLAYCDNVSAIYLIVNSVKHQRTKHIEIDIHLVLTFALFEEFRISLSVRPSPAQTMREC